MEALSPVRSSATRSSALQATDAIDSRRLRRWYLADLSSFIDSPPRCAADGPRYCGPTEIPPLVVLSSTRPPPAFNFPST